MNYVRGSDVVGAEPAPYLVVRVKNIEDLLRQKAGELGGFAARTLPQTVTAKVYDEIKSTLDTEFKKQGVQADISVLSQLPMNSRPYDAPEAKTGFAAGAVVGVLGCTALYTIYRVIKAA